MAGPATSANSSMSSTAPPFFARTAPRSTPRRSNSATRTSTAEAATASNLPAPKAHRNLRNAVLAVMGARGRGTRHQRGPLISAAGHGPRRHRGDSVLEDQLLLFAVLQQDRKFVEGTYPSMHPHAIHQVNGQRGLVLAHSIEIRVLHVLRGLAFHVPLLGEYFRWTLVTSKHPQQKGCQQ